jgi:hypothetical protein
MAAQSLFVDIRAPISALTSQLIQVDRMTAIRRKAL